MLDAIPVSVCRWLVETLGHSLWQACLIAMACWLALRVLPARRTNLRYAISCLGLLAIVGSSLVTLSLLTPGSETNVARTEFPQSDSTGQPILPQVMADLSEIELLAVPVDSPGTQIIDGPEYKPRAEVHSPSRRSVSGWAGRLLHGLSLVWAGGSLLMLVRVVRSVLHVRRLGAEAESSQVTSELLERIHAVVADVSRRLGLRSPVSVLISSRVLVPGVAGTLWPVLLMPPALVSGVPLEQLRIVIAHELAHVRRYDFLVNLAQMVIEALLFFNPAVWWMSRQIRIEREACCDALAVSATGEAIPVARALVEVVARLRESIGDTAANGFAVAAGVQQLTEDPQRESSLLDRVRRIIAPEQRPHVRLPWYSLFGFLVAFATLSAGLYEGTDAAVKAVQQALSPKDRVETLARLKALQTGVFLPPASDGTTKKGEPGAGTTTTPPAGKGGEKADDGQIAINVTLKMDDGSPLPVKTKLTYMTQTGHSSRSASLDSPLKEETEFKTTFRVPSCQLAVSANAPGFASVMTKPLTVFVEKGDRNVELLMTRGFSTTIHVLDPDGKPIANARLKVADRISLGGGWSSSDSRDMKADEQGVARIERLSGMQYVLDVRAAGFQHDQRVITFSADAPVDWILEPADPTLLKFVDADTGMPVSGTRVVVFNRVIKSPTHTHSHGYSDPRNLTREDPWRTFGKSDADGRVVLDELKDQTRYLFAVQAEGYGTTYLKQTRAGQAAQTIRLTRPVTISGQLTGDLSQLKKNSRRKNEYQFSYHNDVPDRDHSHSALFTANVDSEGRFQLDDLVHGKAILSLPDGRKTLVVDGSRDDLKFAVDDTDNPRPKVKRTGSGPAKPGSSKREVVLRLKGTSPEAPARGQMYVSWRTRDEFQNGPLPILNNEVRIQVPISTEITFWPRDVVGYRVDRSEKPVRIVAGKGAQIVEILTRLAGGVHGRVTRSDGSPATNTDVMAFAIKLPKGLKRNSDVNPGSRQHREKFFRSLPYGGRYVMLAREQREGGYSWAVSDEFTIDADNPIENVDLQLQSGKQMTLRILDSNGEPVGDVIAEMSIAINYPGTEGGSSFRLGAETGGFGMATFASAMPEAGLSPLVVTPTLIVPGPPGHIGFSGVLEYLDEVAPSIFELRMQKGVAASGVLLDAKTGRPVPNADIQIFPSNFNGSAAYRERIGTTSDSEGKFYFDNLEPIKYQAQIKHAMPKGTVITPRGQGYSFTYPNGSVQITLQGGAADPVRWEVELYPGGGLSPVPE